MTKKKCKHEWRAIVLEKHRRYKIKDVWCILCSAHMIKDVEFR